MKTKLIYFFLVLSCLLPTSLSFAAAYTKQNKAVEKLKKLQEKYESLNQKENFEDSLTFLENISSYTKTLKIASDRFTGKGLRKLTAKGKAAAISTQRLEKALNLVGFLQKTKKWFELNHSTKKRIKTYINEIKSTLGNSLDNSHKEGYVPGTQLTPNQLLQKKLPLLRGLLNTSKKLKIEEESLSSFIRISQL